MTDQDSTRQSKHERIKIDFWYDEGTRAIHLTSGASPDFHVALNGNPASAMGHRQLYRRLKQILQEAGKWPTGVD